MNKTANKPVVKYDFKADVLYILAKKGIEEEFVEIVPGVSLEMDERGDVIGIEILNASRLLHKFFNIKNKQLQTVY